MLRRALTLLAHPAFRDRPVRMLARSVAMVALAMLRRAPAFRLVPGGARLRVEPRLGHTPVAAYVLRERAEPELALLDRWLAPGATFVDVGANIGLYTLRAAPLVGRTGRVVAVEPGREAFAALRANLALNDFPQAVAVQAALAEAPGTAPLYHTAGGYDAQAFSLLADPDAAGTEEVTVTTLDALAAELGLARLDCLKIDVEGVEARVIDGGRETIRRFRPVVLMEVNAWLVPDAARDPRGAWDRLAALGYRFERLDAAGRTVPLPAFPTAFCNVIGRPAGPAG